MLTHVIGLRRYEAKGKTCDMIDYAQQHHQPKKMYEPRFMRTTEQPLLDHCLQAPIKWNSVCCCRVGVQQVDPHRNGDNYETDVRAHDSNRNADHQLGGLVISVVSAILDSCSNASYAKAAARHTTERDVQHPKGRPAHVPSTASKSTQERVHQDCVDSAELLSVTWESWVRGVVLLIADAPMKDGIASAPAGCRPA